MTISAIDWWRVPDPAPAGDERDTALPFRALVMFTVVLVLAPQSFIPALGPLRPAMLAAVAGFVLYVTGRVVRRQPMTIRATEITAAGWLVCWAIVTIPFSYWPGGSVAFLSNVFLKTLAVFWLLCNVVSTVPRLRTMVWALVLLSVPLALTAAKNFLSGTFAPAAQVTVNRIVGYDAPLALNPNDLALMLNLIAPLALALLLASRTPATRAALAAVVALDVVAVVLTFSRAGFVTLAVTVAATLWKLRRRKEAPWACAALVVALASTPFLPAGYADRLSTIADIDSDPTGSSQARWADMNAAVQFVARNPILGAGIGQDILALNDVRGAKWLQVHNSYLEYAVELGLPGLALFVTLLGSSIQSARVAAAEARRAGSAEELVCIAEGIETSLIGFAVAAFFHPAGYQFDFYYFAGLAVAARAAALSRAVR